MQITFLVFVFKYNAVAQAQFCLWECATDGSSTPESNTASWILK